MPIDKNNVLFATREAVKRARAAAGTGPCEICGAQPASPYAFAYAREVSHKTISTGTGTETTTYYDSVEARIVHLCPQCVEVKGRQMINRSLKATIIAGMIFVATIALAWLFGHGDLTLPLAVAGVIIVGLIYGQRGRTAKDPRVAGQAKALELHEGELRRQGYTKFWSDPSDPAFLNIPGEA